MLHAISLNKGGRNFKNTEINWRQLFSSSEDSLTSTILGTLRYLPQELFWYIINESCYTKFKTVPNTSIEEFHFWPHWQKAQIINGRYIEPDVFIRTKSFDLIIEAKRYDNNQQLKTQWEHEFITYLNEYGLEEKEVFFLAIGGISNENSEIIYYNGKKMQVLKCRWKRILYVIKKILFNLEKSKGHLNNIDSTIIILKDLILGFRIHGYSTGEWFETFEIKNHEPIKETSLSHLLKTVIS